MPHAHIYIWWKKRAISQLYRLNIRATYCVIARVEVEVHGADFKWSQIPSPEERRKSERRSGRRSPSPVRNGGDGISRVYEGGRLVGEGGTDKTDGVRRISSFQAYGWGMQCARCDVGSLDLSWESNNMIKEIFSTIFYPTWRQNRLNSFRVFSKNMGANQFLRIM